MEPVSCAVDTNSWSAAWTRAGSIDVLEVTALRARSWSFVWPGRVVVEPLSEGSIVSASTERRQVLPLGCVLAAEPYAAHLGIACEAGSRFRVLFEEAREPEGRWMPRQRVPVPRLCVSDPARAVAEILAGAFADAPGGPDSWRVPPAVARARQHIEQNLGGDFGLEELSALVGAERCYLCRLFQRALGLPPHRYRAHLRIARGRVMLAAGHDGTEVAYALGFCDQSHFTRCFKELTGTTPGSYVRACDRRPPRPTAARLRSAA